MSEDLKSHLAHLGRLIYERHLTDSAGGNLSVRQGNLIYMSPRYAGSRKRWDLEPSDILVLDLEGHVLKGAGEISRESQMHLSLYRSLEEIGAIIHAHPQWIMVFACLKMTIYPLTEVTKKFGPIRPIAPVKAHSEELAAAVVREVLSRRQELKAHALGLLIPAHGIVVVARDLDEAYDALERMEGNARCALFSRLLEKELTSEDPLGEENPLPAGQE